MTNAVVLIFALVAAGQRPAGETELRIGIAAGDSARYCLALPGPALGAGSPVALVTPAQRQRLYRLVTVRAVSECPAMAKDNTPGPYYLLAPETGSALPEGLGVAVQGRPAVRVVGGQVRLRLANSIPEARIRSCTSNEGLHLTVWSGVPLSSRRLWHAYWYLGYDVDPNCRPADYEEPASGPKSAPHPR
jgi:antitoxin (DNA-binding transcriptional repressor) of toxin-antitoxin stability system